MYITGRDKIKSLDHFLNIIVSLYLQLSDFMIFAFNCSPIRDTTLFTEFHDSLSKDDVLLELYIKCISNCFETFEKTVIKLISDIKLWIYFSYFMNKSGNLVLLKKVMTILSDTFMYFEQVYNASLLILTKLIFIYGNSDFL